MGHPEKLSGMPFLVPLKSAILAQHFDIFVLFAYSTTLLSDVLPYRMKSTKVQTLGADI